MSDSFWKAFEQRSLDRFTRGLQRKAGVYCCNTCRVCNARLRKKIYYTVDTEPLNAICSKECEITQKSLLKFAA